MPTPIRIRLGTLEIPAELNDSPSAKALAAILPAAVRLSRWGDEYYGNLPKPLNLAESPDAREEMTVGELAYWPPGNALCIFFGPTPASTDDTPRAASPVNPLGKITGDTGPLKALGRSVQATVTKAG